jgi:hypothetical protein
MRVVGFGFGILLLVSAVVVGLAVLLVWIFFGFLASMCGGH